MGRKIMAVVDLASDALVWDGEYLRDLVFRATGAVDYRPPMLPDVVVRLMKLSADPNVNFSGIEEVVACDAAIAAKIVATANTAYFSRGVRIESLRTAISRLGLLQIRDLAFHAAVNARIFKVAQYHQQMVAERRHALGAALLCRQICRNLGIDPEMAFLCGLLHDIGKVITMGIVADYCRIRKCELPSASEIHRQLDEVHSEVGRRIATLWKLPGIVVEAVDFHHHPFNLGELCQMAGVVAVADLCCRHAGIGRERRHVDVLSEKIFFDLNMHPDDADQLMMAAEDLVVDLPVE